MLPPPDVFCCRKSAHVWDAILEGTGGQRKEAETDEYDPSRPAVIGGLDYGADRLLDRALREAQAPFFFVDRAHFGGGIGSNRFRVIANAYHQLGVLKDVDPARFEATGVVLRPRMPPGKHIFVCPSSEKHHRFFGCPDWLERTVDRLHELTAGTDKRIVVRRKYDGPPFAHLLKYGEPAGVVAYASNAAVEAVTWGVPVFTERGPARPVSCRTLEQLVRDPFFPTDEQRLAWARSLAACDYSVDELRNGYMWRTVNARLGL
jgi:hypothetical protein